MDGTFITNQRLAGLAARTYNAERVVPGPIAYTRTHLYAAELEHVKRAGPCNLITSFSDASVTDDLAAKLPPNVHLWFSNNVATHNPRVVAVPIGIRFSDAVEASLRAARAAGRLPDRRLAYLCCLRNIPRVPNPREGIYEQFAGLDWVTAEGGFDHVSSEQFYRGMREHPYVISPPGAGPDCHRHWEAILLGAVPIVLRSRATDLLSDLPCLRVENWAEVTRERLEAELPSLRARFAWPQMARCFMEWWRPRVLGEPRALACGVSRSGSTLVWQLLSRLLPGEPVLKVHPCECVPGGEWIFASVRHPCDVAASRYRFRLARSPDPASDYVSGWVGVEAELHLMRRQFEALAALRGYPRFVALRYEDFVERHAVVYDEVERALKRPVPAAERARLSEECGVERNRARGASQEASAAEFAAYQIHPGHVGLVRPGQWRDVIPKQWQEAVLQFCRPIAEAWGYSHE